MTAAVRKIAEEMLLRKRISPGDIRKNVVFDVCSARKRQSLAWTFSFPWTV
jgi:hypothetical protein